MLHLTVKWSKIYTCTTKMEQLKLYIHALHPKLRRIFYSSTKSWMFLDIFLSLSLPLSPSLSLLSLPPSVTSPPHQRMARSRVEVTKSLLYIDQTFIHSVRAHLHTYKKCFQGKDFVRTVIKLGEKTHSPAVLQSSSTRQAEPSPLVRSMSYTQQYAVDMGQHLLQQGALIEVPLGDHLHALNIPHPVAEGGRAEGAAIGVGSYGVSGSLERRKAMDSAPTRALGENTAQVFPTSFQGTAPFQVQGTTPSQVHGATTACFTVDAWYKFAEPEDSDSRALYASQVLCASSVSGSSSSCEVDFSQDMDKARTGSLFLVSDLLLQRSKERVAKQFLQTNSARNVLEQKRTSVSTSCDYIFKL